MQRRVLPGEVLEIIAEQYQNERDSPKWREKIDPEGDPTN